MITPKQIKRVVEQNRKHLNIKTRVEMENMIWLTMELLEEAGYEDAARSTKSLYNEIEEMDTSELAREQIWIA